VPQVYGFPGEADGALRPGKSKGLEPLRISRVGPKREQSAGAWPQALECGAVPRFPARACCPRHSALPVPGGFIDGESAGKLLPARPHQKAPHSGALQSLRPFFEDQWSSVQALSGRGYWLGQPKDDSANQNDCLVGVNGVLMCVNDKVGLKNDGLFVKNDSFCQTTDRLD
jgi:hypothetical protein